MTANTDWIRKGAEVAVITDGAHGCSVRRDTITNITARHIVTDKSGKFQTGTLWPVGRGEYNPTHTQLVPLNDPKVADARAKIRVRNTGTAVYKLTRDFDGDKAAALAVLAEIERAVAVARQAIAGKEN
jgi:hypothetical protein